MKEYKFSQLEYQPNDYEKIAQALTAFCGRIAEAKNVEETVAVIEEYEALMDGVELMCNLAFIRSSLDYTDAYYQEASEKESAGISMLDTAQYYRALLDSSFLPQLEERYGTEFRPLLEQKFRVDAAGHELKAKEQVLVSRYQQKKASLKIEFQGKTRSENEMYVFFSDPDRQTRIEARRAVSEAVLARKEEFAPMLMELIALRDQVAKANGFENYLEFANAGFSRRGYGEAELTAFCEQVKSELVPLLLELQEEQRQELGVDKMMIYDRSIRFADGNAVPAGDAAYLTEQSKKLYDGFSPEFGAFFRGMVDSESLDVTASPHKVAGMGFCTTVGEGYYPYVFGNCNRTDSDVSVFTHEIGHAWQVYLSGKAISFSMLREMALDAVEIPSKSMELFAYPYAEQFFGKDAEKFCKGHFREALFEIAAFCQIHELETWIYTHVGASFEELVQKDMEVERRYDPAVDYGELEPYHRAGGSLMRNMAIYMFPRYVISYSLSEMCAMDLFRKRQEDPAAAWESYEKLCASGGSRNYPQTLRQAGLEPAYAPGRVRRVVEFARDYLKRK